MTDYELSTMLRELDQHREPPFPPGHLEQTLTLARVKAKRHRIGRAATAVAMTVLLGLAGFVLPGQITSGGGGAGESVVLPDHVAGYDLLTAPLSQNPSGQALMLFESGNSDLFYTMQALTLHTDGRSYRQLDAARGSGGTLDRQALLSPEGDAVLLAEKKRATAAFTYIDLRTGAARQIALETPAGVMLHAWSPDGKAIAYAQVPWARDDSANALKLATRGQGVLTILDLDTGLSVPYPEITPAAAASFGPGGDQLAVQKGGELWMLNLPDGRKRQLQGRVPEPGLGLVPGTAWSPDGRWLALIPWNEDGAGGRQPGAGPMPYGKTTFIDATGVGWKAPDPVEPGSLLGWRNPETVIMLRDGALYEVGLETGQTKHWSSFDKPHSCGLWTKECQTFEIQLATGLLNSVVVKPATGAQRGPWPVWLQLVTATATILLGIVLFRVVRRITLARGRALG